MSPAGSSTDARLAAADMLRTALPDVSVFPAWPNTASPPCVIVGLGLHTQLSGCLWDAEVMLTCVAPGGDNDGALAALEDLADRVTLATRDIYRRAERDPPVQTLIGGTTHLTVLVRSTVTITL